MVFAEMLGFLGNEKRLRVSQALVQNKGQLISVGDLVELTGLTQPDVSSCLRRGFMLGFFDYSQDGTHRYYFIRPDLNAFEGLVNVTMHDYKEVLK